MKILIDADKLHMLLLLHENDIWLSKADKYRSLLEQFLLGFTVYTAVFPNFFLSCLFKASVPILITWSIWQMVKSDNYSMEKLQKDIQGLNEITHPFSLVAIMDTFHEHPNKFLVYYDRKWKCKFLLNYKTAAEHDEASICARLAQELQINLEDITIGKCAERIQKKFNPNEEIEKTYLHTLYNVKIANFPEKYKQSIFEVDGKSFYWMSISEMEQDKDILEKNMDVLSLVKECIL